MIAIIFQILFVFQFTFLFSQDIQNKSSANDSVFLEKESPEALNINPSDDISLFYYFQGIFIFLFFILLFYLLIKYIESKKKEKFKPIGYPFKKVDLDFNKSLYFFKMMDYIYIFASTDQSISLVDKIPYSEKVELFLKEIGIYSLVDEEEKSNTFSFKKVFKYYQHFFDKK